MSVVARARSVVASGGLRGLVSSGRAYLAHHPLLARTLAHARLEYYRSVHGYEALADPFALIEVDPNAIVDANHGINKYLEAGAVRGGDWDRRVVPYEESLKYRSVEQRFVEGRDWEETVGHDALCRRLEAEGEVDGCFSLADLQRRYERIDGLYESMRRHGYDPARGYDGPDTRVSTALDQVCVSIGRDGALIFCGGGNHRLSIAKVLELETIPVRVVVRHAAWQARRERVVAAGLEESQSHPDLCEFAEP
ncbi:hypothetical protein [Natrononativus amylolyticus]|uniref:hypothetical protein n=1 Tax=Natrononativus amylolyticus TaxID=2963434 RepID=UPI0020CEFDD5|nr:hypothetical protein [Natrononativus amylolyticus]